MKILVSACLLGRNCKYNGGSNLDPRVVEFLRGKEIIEICPEELAGLGIPRVPIEIVNGETLTSYMADVDTDEAFTPDTEAIVDGVFQESKFRSGPYFDVQIDGITLLDVNYG